MLTIFLRAFILYIIMLITLRGMGKHQLGQFQPYEFAMAMLIADLIASPMSNIATPLLYGVLPLAALFITHGVITMISMRSDKIRAFISGKPAVVISRGQIDRKELDRLCLSLSDLLEGLRESGILDPREVGTAVIEANGNISAFPHAQFRAPTCEELKIKTNYEGLPLQLIMDGCVQASNLKLTGIDEPSLHKMLMLYNLQIKDVLLAGINTQGILHLQDMKGAQIEFRALDANEVKW